MKKIIIFCLLAVNLYAQNLDENKAFAVEKGELQFIFDDKNLLNDLKQIEFNDRAKSIFIKKNVSIFIFIEDKVLSLQDFFAKKVNKINFDENSLFFVVSNDDGAFYYIVGSNNFEKFDTKYIKYLKTNSEKLLKNKSISDMISFLLYDIDVSLSSSNISNSLRINKDFIFVLVFLVISVTVAFFAFKKRTNIK